MSMESVDISNRRTEHSDISITDDITIFFLSLVSVICPAKSKTEIEGIASASPISPSDSGSFVIS